MVELGTVIKNEKSQLEQVAAGLAEGKSVKVVGALLGLLVGITTGHPEVGALLSPFVAEGARRAFAATATRRLQTAWAEAQEQSKANQDRTALVSALVSEIEVLLGQALVQIVRVQHRTKDELVEALGGLRAEFADFREDFQNRLDDEGVRIDVQRVREGATGVRISDGARARVWVKEQTVTGDGSVGVDVRRT